MDYDIQIETISTPRRTAVVRRQAALADLPKVVPDGCGIVWNVIRPLRDSGAIKGVGRNLALYLDDAINLEVGIELKQPLDQPRGEVIGSTLPTGTVATALHLGPYQQLKDAHAAIRAWCAKRGHALDGRNWEIYGHWREEWNADPSRIRTDVYYLLSAAAAG